MTGADLQIPIDEGLLDNLSKQLRPNQGLDLLHKSSRRMQDNQDDRNQGCCSLHHEYTDHKISNWPSLRRPSGRLTTLIVRLSQAFVIATIARLIIICLVDHNIATVIAIGFNPSASIIIPPIIWNPVSFKFDFKSNKRQDGYGESPLVTRTLV